MHFDWFDSAHHRYAQYKQKGFALVFIFLGIAILTLLVPIPEYKEIPFACPMIYGVRTTCISKKSWVMGKPLLWRIVLKFTMQPPVRPNSPIATPIPKAAETVNPATGGANWKIYTNLKNGFSFRYPSNWIDFKFKNPTTNTEYQAFSSEHAFDYDQLSNKGIIVLVNTQETRKLSTGWKQTTVGGVQAGRLSLESMRVDKYGPTWSDTIIFKDRNLSLSLTTRTLEAVQNNEQTYNQILSTFKFN